MRHDEHHDDHVHIHRPGIDPDMLSVEEALGQVLSFTRVLPTESRPLLECLDVVLAEDIISTVDIPPLPNSGMDGYAVCMQDLEHASETNPALLPVVGKVAAGEVPDGPLVPGTAVRIMTGAPVPDNSGAVVPFEDTDETDRRDDGRSLDEIGVLRPPRAGANIRAAGEDVRIGQIVLTSGQILGPVHLGVAASLGLTHLPVTRRPVVAIVSTGDEIIEPGENLRPGTIYNSNASTIGGMVLRHGGIPKIVGTALDTEDSLNIALDRAMDADLVLTSAGVSKGDYDVVKLVLASRGEIVNKLVRMKPARPLAFGTFKAADDRIIPHLGLPGNPVAVVVAFEAFARPAILAMQGKKIFDKPTVQAVMDDTVRNSDNRRVYARVLVYRGEGGEYRAKLSGSQGSGVLTAVAAANGMAICPEDVSGLALGDIATVQMFDWPEILF